MSHPLADSIINSRFDLPGSPNVPLPGLRNGRKRGLSELSESGVSEDNEKYARYEEVDASGRPAAFRYLVLHRVRCGGEGAAHGPHPDESFFLDTPRLFAGDNKASRLRGSMEVPDLEDFLDENTDISFTVYKDYDCEEYQESMQHQFRRHEKIKVAAGMSASLRPYLFSLDEDAPAAESMSQELTIVSEDHNSAIKRLTALDDRILTDVADCQSMEPPYLEIYHSRLAIEALMPDHLGASRQSHIQLLLDYVKGSYGADHQEADVLFQSGFVSRDHFSKLFTNKEVLISGKDASIHALFCESCQPNRHSVNIAGWSWHFDGSFRKEPVNISLNWPAPEKDQIMIADLEVYPLRFDSTNLEARLRERGTKFWECRRRNFVTYHAQNPSFEIQATKPRYMVDMYTYRQMHSEEAELPAQQDDLGSDAMESEEPPVDPFLLLLPAHIPGFSFDDKKWRTLSVENTSPIEWNKSAFQRLVMKEHKKELVHALVSVHMDTRHSTDIITGKGNGLILLLHGPPGTGKTLTAESVAELAEKPLYRVTCGDIGTNPESVEKYLESVLELGTTWDCVVLLDEADVFLEAREKADLQRNALVSVFLRVLEYYEGILILTTNRIGQFDEAFKSRIQLALHYPKLDAKGRWAIWRNSLKSLSAVDTNLNMEQLLERTDELATHNLNGRQIRNTIKTARQLAQFRKEELRYLHLESAIEVAKEFEDYLAKTHNYTDEEWAQNEGIR